MAILPSGKMQAIFKHGSLKDARLHGLYWANTRIAMILVSLDTNRILDANPATEKLTGYDRSELAGLQHFRLYPESERGLLEVAYRTNLNVESGCDGFHILRRDGVRVPVAIMSSGAFESNGECLAICGFCDMTDLELKQRRFQSQNLALAAYAGAASAFGKAGNSRQLLQSVCEAIVRQPGYALAWIAVADEGEDKQIEMAASAGGAVNYLDGLKFTWSESEPEGKGPLGVCIRTATAQVMEDSEALENFKPWRVRARNAGLRSAVTVPLRVERGRRGALVIYSSHTRGFDAPALELFRDLAGQIGRVVHAFDRESPLKTSSANIRRTQTGMTEALTAISESIVIAADKLGDCGASQLRRVSETSRIAARDLKFPDA